jgi:hypothetical protein
MLKLFFAQCTESCMRNVILDGLIQRCSVVAEVLPTPVSDCRSSARSAKRNIAKINQRAVPTVCVYCNVLFPCKGKAFQHAFKDHKDIETARCNICKIYVKSKTDLRTHRREFHKFLCLFCSRYLINELAYQKHVNSMHANVAVECKLCKKSCVYFKTQAAYKKHIAHKHEGEWKCIYCSDSNFRSMASLRSHIIRHHHKNEVIVCSHVRCRAFFKTEAEKLIHEKDVHASKADLIECDICKVRVLQPNLTTHMRQFHNFSFIGKNLGGKKTTCCYCLKIFPSRTANIRHVKDFHSNITTFFCYTCKLNFPNLELKQKHNQKMHSGKFTCIYCSNWSCTNLSNLWRHIKLKHESDAMQCKYNKTCALYFKTQGDLQKHISESHESDARDILQCIYCSKFIPCNTLKCHINLHHKSVAVRCSVTKTCCKYFLTKEDLEEHVLKVHLTGNVENRKCPYCNKVYTNFYHTQTHAQTSHGKTLLKCTERGCLFMCSSSVNLQKHLLEQHSETEKLKIHCCMKCNFKSKNLVGLKFHNLRMHGTEKLKCSACSKNKYFKSACALKSHLKQVHQSKRIQ